MAAAPNAKPKSAPGSPPTAQTPYRIYFVVPKNIGKFDAKRRSELGIMGKYLNGWAGRKEFKNTQGFSAWLTPAEAAKVRSQPDVRKVHELQPEDVVVVGKARRGFMTLRVVLTPNNWPVRPDHSTYLSTFALADQWSKQFAKFRDVRVTTVPTTSDAFVSFGRMIPKQVIEALKANPQVSYMEWVAGATTFAVGEEGGQPQPITTQALGEEGGVTTTWHSEEGGGVTTMRLGEEGGNPFTTQALGEEGGKPPTTRRFGEEGGTAPTTHRMGEEGGTWSPTQPAPSTRAMGEEGGSPPPGTATTMALGEEG